MKNLYVPRTSILAEIFSYLVIGVLCGIMGYLIAYQSYKSIPQMNDLQNQIIELRTEQTVIRGRFESISTLYQDLRARVEIEEEKSNEFAEIIRRP